MATLKDYRDERLRKLAELKELGFNPYPAKSNRTHGAGEVVGSFSELEGQTVTLAGRIVSIRKFGKLAFVVLKDQTGQIQLFIRDGVIEQTDPSNNLVGIKQLNLLDTGDFIQATGPIIKTKTDEISIEVNQLKCSSE